jgi:hypothetical protein
MDDDIWLDADEDDVLPSRRTPQASSRSWDKPGRAPQKKKTSTTLIVVIVIGCILSLSAVGIIAYVAMDRLGGVTVAGHRSRSTLNAESTKVFSQFDVQNPLAGLPADELPVRDGILELISRLETFSESRDPTEVSDVVDLKRLTERIELTGGLADWNRLDKVQLQSRLVEFAVDDIQLGSVTLTGFVKVADDPQTRVAYVFAEDLQSSDQAEFRL